MARLYSHKLWADISVGVSTVASPTVPTGETWVVRDVTASNSFTPVSGMAGVTILTAADLVPIFAVLSPGAASLVVYHWTGHQVLEAGDGMIANYLEAGWGIRISGYRLVGP